jgi:hypothetical protein
MSSDEILSEQMIPQDVRNAYEKFVDKNNKEFDNKGMDYSIISKTDCRIYMFSKDHKLLSIQSILL